MADESTDNLKLNLDIKEFVEAILHAKETISGLGESEGLANLTKGLMGAGVALGAMGVAVFAFKEAFDLVKEGEQISAINAQFEMLTKNAGLSANEFKEHLVPAAHGLATETEVLEAANKALLTLGSNASRSAEIMELARKSAAVMGGTMIEKFEEINQAIATGNQRGLKHAGIIVDINQVYKQYAESHQILAGRLTQSEKQQALLNATINAGNERLKNIDPNIKMATNAWTRFKVAMSETTESFAVGAARVFGKTFGDDTERTRIRIDELKESVGSYQKRIDYFKEQAEKGSWFGPSKEASEKKIEELKSSIAQANAEISKLEPKLPAEKKGLDPEAMEKDEREKDRVKKLSDATLAIKKDYLIALGEVYTSEEDLAHLESENEQLLNVEKQNKIAEINKLAKQTGIKDSAEHNAMLNSLDEEYANKKIALNQRELDDYIKMTDHQMKAAKTMGEGFSSAAAHGAAIAKREMFNFAKQSEMIIGAFSKHAENSLMAMGEGTESAADAMRGFMFGAIADIAQQEGAYLVAAGIGTMNPASVAAGAALFVLAGYLRGQAKGTTGGSASGGIASGGMGGGGAGGGGGETGGGAAIPGTINAPRPDLQGNAPHGKSVTIQVQGHYFETEQTQQKLADLVRSASDAQDFRILQIGQH